MTNGEKFKEIFPNVQTDELDGHALVNFIINDGKRVVMSACGAREEWWNSEYKEGPADEWKEWTDERWGGTTIYCPYCKEDALEKYSDGLHRQVKSNFCPNCGIKLEKGGTE